MNRAARLQSARRWLATFTGKNVVRAYARWFGVDLGCALKELQMLGAPLDSTYVQRLMETLRNRAIGRPVAAQPPDALPDTLPHGYGVEWDDDFAYIAGFTSGGARFGVSWEE